MSGYLWWLSISLENLARPPFLCRDLVRDHGLSTEDALIMRQLMDLPGGLELHIGMFIPTLQGQATPEQQAKWLKPSLKLEIIGTYAQTELGHGTFVRGLETTAVYDPSSQEFVLHSPTLTATKWWPGGLAKSSSHAVVMARLFVGGKDHGPHAFVVQLRDLSTHQPLPGVTVGDIGPKFGYNGVDNGFLRFDHVRLPRDHLLMKNAQVTPEGRYVPPPPGNEKAAYGTMVFVRATIVRDAGYALARAATIAARYCAVRRQTVSVPGQRETQVLDYANTQAVVLPSVAASYALHFMGQSMMGMYEDSQKRGAKGDYSQVPELHALSSGLKALCTDIAAGQIEACRRTCGGHGFSQLSGLPHAYSYYVQNVTWEGDNSVMLLQCARFLIKQLEASLLGGGAGRGGAASSAAYLADAVRELSGSVRSGTKSAECWLTSPSEQEAAIRHAAVRLLAQAREELLSKAGGASGPVRTEGVAWNATTVSLIKAARAHCYLALVRNFTAVVQAARPGSPLRSVLEVMSNLFALNAIEHEFSGVLLEDAFMNGVQAAALRSAVRISMERMRPNAVALVDAFDFSDYFLNSALGRSDGNVYQALYDTAQRSPLNRTAEGPAWQSVIKPGRGTNGSVTPPSVSGGGVISGGMQLMRTIRSKL